MTTTARHHRPVGSAVVAVVAALVALLSVLAACGGDDATTGSTTTTTDVGPSTTSGSTDASGATSAPTVSGPWVREAATDRNSAAYMTIIGGDQADALVGASLPDGIAGEVQLHETTTEESDGMDMSDGHSGDGPMGGMMSMRPVGEIPIPAGGSVSLEPGGYHIMLIDLTRDLVVGTNLPIVLTFASGATSTVQAEVRAN